MRRFQTAHSCFALTTRNAATLSTSEGRER